MTRSQLYEVETLQGRIDKLKREARELRDEAEAIGSPSNFGERVLRSAPSGAPFEAKIIKADGLDNIIRRLELQQAEARTLILEASRQLEPEDKYYILRRHAELWTTKRIAADAGVTQRTVQRKLAKAVSNILKI